MPRWLLYTFGAIGLVLPGVAFALAQRREAEPSADDDATSADDGGAALAARLPAYAERFAGPEIAGILYRAGTDFGLAPLLLAQVIDLESGFGRELTPPGPGGTGDHGHGHGLSQIDDRSWGPWLMQNAWTDAETNVRKGAEILSDDLGLFRGAVGSLVVAGPDGRGIAGEALELRAGLSAYNAGPSKVMHALSQGIDPGTVTSKAANGLWYPDNVLRRLA